VLFVLLRYTASDYHFGPNSSYITTQIHNVQFMLLFLYYCLLLWKLISYCVRYIARATDGGTIPHQTTTEESCSCKVVIRSRISKKNKQHYGQKKKYKSTNNDLQNIHIILKNPTKTRGELGCSGRVGSCFSTSGPRYVTLVTHPVISHE
jgi:hypothetical protein